MPASKETSIRAVARAADVSVATVSRIVNGIRDRAAPETIARVEAAIKALDYRPQSVGRALRQRESRIVGVLVANLSNPAMAAIAASIEVALRTSGYVMALCDTHEDPEIQDEYLREMEAQLASAIVMVVAVHSPGLDLARKSGRPLVFVSRRDPGDPAAPFVGINDEEAGHAVAACCLERGWRQPSVLHASIQYSAGALRLKGLRDGFARAGIEIATFTADGRHHMEIGYLAARKAFSAFPGTDVMIALSDLLAYGAYRAVNERHARAAPALFSFDGNPLNDWIGPWLNSVRVPHEKLGPQVVEALEGIVTGQPPRAYFVPFELTRR